MENSFVKWLKKIFTVQSVALIISVITVVITWKQFYISDSSELQLKIYSPLYGVNVTHKTICDVYKYIEKDTIFADQLIPQLANETNRSVKNVCFKVIIYPYNCYFLDLKGDSIPFNPKEDYIYDLSVMPAFSVRPLPINKVVIKDSIFASFKLYMYVTHDGIEKPITYTSEITLNKYDEKLTDCPPCYMEWRNTVFDNIYDRYGSKSKTDDEYCFVIGDTIIPSVNNLHVFNRKETHIDSLNDVAEFVSWWEIISILVAIVVFILVFIYSIRLVRFLPPLFSAFKDNYYELKTHGIKAFLLATQHDLEVFEDLSFFEAWAVIYLAIPATLFIIFVIIFFGINWSDING